MTHTNLDRAPEAARQYVLSLLVPEGTILEMDGRAVARVVPVPQHLNGTSDNQWTPEKNHRRCTLVDLEIDCQITPEEQSELRDLERQLDRHLDKVAPVPLDALRKLHGELLEEAAKAHIGPRT